MTAHWKSRLCTIGASAVRCDFTEKEAGQALIEDNTGVVAISRFSKVQLDFSALVHGVEIGPSISYHQSDGALAASPFLFGFNIESPVQVSQDLLSSTMERVQEA